MTDSATILLWRQPWSSSADAGKTVSSRGFLAGLKKKGFTIETLDRVRMVGPNKGGAKGAYTVYRIAG